MGSQKAHREPWSAALACSAAMRSTHGRAAPSPYKTVRYPPSSSLASRNRPSAFTPKQVTEEPPTADEPAAAAVASASSPPAAVLLSNLPAAACNGLYVLVDEDDACESPRYTNGEGQHLYCVKEFEHRALVRKWVISSNYSPGGSSIGRRAVVSWADGDCPPMGDQKWLIITDSTVTRAAADESTLVAPVTLTAIPQSSVAALTSLESAAQRARSQKRDAEVELTALKRQLQAKEADAAKAEAERTRLEEKAQRTQSDMERMNARFEGLIQDKVAEISRLNSNIKDIKQEQVAKSKQDVNRVEGGYGKVVDMLRSLSGAQVHSEDAVSVLSEYIEESCKLGDQPVSGGETLAQSSARDEAATKVPLWENQLWDRLLIQPPVEHAGKADDFAKGMEVLFKAAEATAAQAPQKLMLDQLPTSTQSLSGLENFLVVKEALKKTFVLSQHSREQCSLAQFYRKGKHAEPALAAFYGKDEAERSTNGGTDGLLHTRSATWHCVVDGSQESAEYELQELCNLYLNGRVTDDTKCWTEGMSEWSTIGSLGAFSAVREQRSGVTAISLAINGFMRQLDAGVQPYLRECGGMRSLDRSIAHIIERCVQQPMHACLALKTEQMQAAQATAVLLEKQHTCEQEIAQLASVIESGTSRISKEIESIDTVYSAVSLTDLREASVALSEKEADLHKIMQERLTLNASLREISSQLLVGESAEQRVEALHGMVVDDVATFATKQTKCSKARETIATEIQDIRTQQADSEATVENLRHEEQKARELRLKQTAAFVEQLRELVSAELASEKEFRGLVEQTNTAVAEQQAHQMSLVEPLRQLERAQREMMRYERAYGAAGGGLRQVETATTVMLGRTDCVMEQHQRCASAWHKSILRDHIEIWRAKYELLQKQLTHEQGRQAELLEEEAQLERQTVRALRAGNKVKINELQDRKRELSVEITHAVARLAELEARLNEMFTPEIDRTAAELNQQHPAVGRRSATSTAAHGVAAPPPPLPITVGGDEEDAAKREEELEDEEEELEIFVVLVGTKEPHGPLTINEAKTALSNGSVTTSSLGWCEGMDGWAPLRSSEIIAPLLNLHERNKPRQALPPALPRSPVAVAAQSLPTSSPRSTHIAKVQGSPRPKGLSERTNSSCS